MKSIIAINSTLTLSNLILWMLLASGWSHAESEKLSYHFIGFEATEGYSAGKFRGTGVGLQWLQGDAQIVHEETDKAGQYLKTVAGDPFAAVHFRGQRVSQDDHTYYEVWVRPSVSLTAKSEEFMDLDGAVVGFFADTPAGAATFHAYHALPEQSGYWVSTGVTAKIDSSGMAQEWIRIGISQNLITATWDLTLGDQVVLKDIRLTEVLKKDEIQLWLLGHETTVNHFDHLLISPIKPDLLRLSQQQLSPQGWFTKEDLPKNLQQTPERKVGRKQSDNTRRRHGASTPKAAAKTTAMSYDFEIDIIAGATQHGKFDHHTSDSQPKNFLLYSPKYDAVGNPLPLQLKIQCDSELAEGVDLSKILWAVLAPTTKEDKATLQVITHGNFSSGFTQIAEIPSKWANKATKIQVGTHLEFKGSP